jgi:hypothetical protein
MMDDDDDDDDRNASKDLSYRRDAGVPEIKMDESQPTGDL